MDIDCNYMKMSVMNSPDYAMVVPQPASKMTCQQKIKLVIRLIGLLTGSKALNCN